MDPSPASPETSPTTVDRTRKPGTELYVPKQRRTTGEEQSPTGDNAEYAGSDKLDQLDSSVVRKGRGQFRGPLVDAQQDGKPARPPRGRDFDATVLRQYPPKAGDKPQKQSGGAKRMSRPGRRDSGESGSSDNGSDEVAKLAGALENASIGDVEKDGKLATDEPTLSPSDHQERLVDTVDWEKKADAEVKPKNVVPAQDHVDNRPKAEGSIAPRNDNAQRNDGTKPQFKKGHKKSKSSKIEFNFDPDAYDGSTRILDIFGFPASYKTHHLHEIFHEYENMRGGYRIKWMDDTRALIIFEHPATARKAYLDNVMNQMATVKPYDGPTDFLQKTTVIRSERRPSTTTTRSPGHY